MAFDFNTNLLLAQDRDFFTSAQAELSGPVQQGDLAIVYVGLRQARESRRHAQSAQELVDRTQQLQQATQEGNAGVVALTEAVMKVVARWRSLPWRGIGDL